jgi:hypothetical protein
LKLGPFDRAEVTGMVLLQYLIVSLAEAGWRVSVSQCQKAWVDTYAPRFQQSFGQSEDGGTPAKDVPLQTAA